MQPIEFVSSINGTTLERVDEIKDLGVIMDRRMSFLSKIEAVIWKLSRMLGFNKRISRESHDPYSHKTLYTALVRPNLEHAACVWSLHQSVYSERPERVPHNFICYAVRRLPWRVWPLPAYDARCLLMCLEVHSDRRIVTSMTFWLAGSIVRSTHLVLLLRFKEVFYSRRRSANSYCWSLKKKYSKTRYFRGFFLRMNRSLHIFHNFTRVEKTTQYSLC
jgi:hypothetical protein